MKDYKQTLLDLIIDNQSNGEKRQIVYLEGGYYDTRFGPTEFSVNTLKACIEIAESIIKKRYRITRVVLGVLINNIGMTCGEDACVIDSREKITKNTDGTISESLEKMLVKSKVTKKDKVIITNERNLRNRGIRTAREMIKEPIKYSLEIDENADKEVLYNVILDGSKIPLAIKRGERLIARCPLIMGQHYLDLYIDSIKKYGNSTNLLLVDFCEMYDRHKVNNGVKVALMILQRMYDYDVSKLKIANFCFVDDELTQYEFDLTEGSK